MSELFALTTARKTDDIRDKRVEVGDVEKNWYYVVVVAIKVDYALIEDSFDHLHDSGASNNTVLKTLYKNKDGKIYYTGAGKYSSYITKKSNSDRTFLTEDQMKKLEDYIDRYKKFKENKEIKDENKNIR